MLSAGILAAEQRQIHDLVAPIHGHLNRKEIGFLFLAAALPTTSGEVLEIGAYMGRSTVALARAALLAGQSRVATVDPHELPVDAGVQEGDALVAEFRRNLQRAGVDENVEYHRCCSQDLAPEWRAPLRLLWIDGDHSLGAARRDLALFSPHLRDGAIVAMHDVLHRTPGPLRVFMEDVLLSPHYGACGICGSIGWAQWLADPARARRHRARKLGLWRRLGRLLPLAVYKRRDSRLDRLRWRLGRARIPHGPLTAAWWRRNLEFGTGSPA